MLSFNAGTMLIPGTWHVGCHPCAHLADGAPTTLHCQISGNQHLPDRASNVFQPAPDYQQSRRQALPPPPPAGIAEASTIGKGGAAAVASG